MKKGKKKRWKKRKIIKQHSKNPKYVNRYADQLTEGCSSSRRHMEVAWTTTIQRKEKRSRHQNLVPDWLNAECCSFEEGKYEDRAHWGKYLAHVHWADTWEQIHYLDYPANSGGWTEMMTTVNDSWAGRNTMSYH